MKVQHLTVEMTLELILSIVNDQLGLTFDIDEVRIDFDSLDYDGQHISIPLVNEG